MLLKNLLLITLFLLNVKTIYAQKIYGKVKEKNGSIVKFASITIKENGMGASSNENGSYAINCGPGNYTISCSYIGYTKVEKTITITDKDIEQDFILDLQFFDQEAIIVKSSKENYANKVIRNAIKKRAFYNQQVAYFKCDLYTKDVLQLNKVPDKFFGRKISDKNKKELGMDSAGNSSIIYLSESVAEVLYKKPNNLKVAVKSSRVSGSNSFGFTIPTFINFNQNNVKVFSSNLNPRGFISPISDRALYYYKFKFLGNFYEDGYDINVIKVTPKRKNEPLFEGTIYIAEDKWFIHSLQLTVTKNNQLELLDSMQIISTYSKSKEEIWQTNKQTIIINANQFGFGIEGNFTNVYSKYNLDTLFTKNTFNSTIMNFENGSNKKTIQYWDSIRPMPLTEKEQKDYTVKDSIFKNTDTLKSRAKMDSIYKKYHKITLKKVMLYGFTYAKTKTKNPTTFAMDGLLPNLEYNTAEGLVINGNFGLTKYSKKLKALVTIQPNIRYGFSNKHLNANTFIALKHLNKKEIFDLNASSLLLGFGNTVTQINSSEPITPQINASSTLFYGNNFLKNYEKTFVGIQYQKKKNRTFAYKIGLVYENRIALINTTNFVIRKGTAINFTPNNFSGLKNISFPNHKAVLLSAEISYQPGQKFIEYPNYKMPIGSKYPTFSLQYTKGIHGILGSSTNFDKWKFSIIDDYNLKLAGAIKYNVNFGGFLNSKKVFIQDYQHFNGNQFLLASSYVNSFQLANYYDNSNIAIFYTQAHLEYHLNGLLTNKIPLLNKLKWNIVTGSNTFYVNKTNNYIEAFVGLENIFKLFRIDLVYGYTNGANAKTGIRIGLGGVLGGNSNGNNNKRSVKKQF